MAKKNLSDEKRTQIALAAIQGKETVAQICAQHNISDVTFYKIKNEALAALPRAVQLARGKDTSKEAQLQKKVDDLKDLVADQACAIQILKKNLNLPT